MVMWLLGMWLVVAVRNAVCVVASKSGGKPTACCCSWVGLAKASWGICRCCGGLPKVPAKG